MKSFEFHRGPLFNEREFYLFGNHCIIQQHRTQLLKALSIFVYYLQDPVTCGINGEKLWERDWFCLFNVKFITCEDVSQIHPQEYKLGLPFVDFIKMIHCVFVYQVLKMNKLALLSILEIFLFDPSFTQSYPGIRNKLEEYKYYFLLKQRKSSILIP